MSDTKRLTVLLPVDIKGDDAVSVFYFRPFRQYCYGREGNLISGDATYYYEVEIEGVKYLIPKDYVQPCSKELSEEQQMSPWEAEYKRLWDNTEKDHKKMALEVLGIDIERNERTDYNGRFLLKYVNRK